MGLQEQQIDDFFNGYCEIYNKGITKNLSDSDLERLADSYSDCFIASNPDGVTCGKNDEQFRNAMSKGYAFYRDIGIVKMEIISNEITILDDFHAMSKIRFKATFKRKHTQDVTGNVEFENIYFTQSKENKHKIFAYISGDEQRTLRESELI